MNEIQVRTKLLLSAQRALLGMIYPSIRAVLVGSEGTEKLKIEFYLDREPNDDDYESLNDVAAEICGDLPFASTEEYCFYADPPRTQIANRMTWVYYRKE